MRNDVSFISRGKKLAGWHYPPTSDALASERGAPAVVMAHGLSMTRDCGLAQYAERFAAAGMNVLVFDYRCFGDSQGQPRELVSARQQVQDYRAALDYARQLPGVDPQRVALWGTSYSGGIAVQCAYEDGRVAALVIQVPNLDNAATGWFMARHLARTDPLRGLWIVWRSVLDLLGGLVGLGPAYVRAVARQGEQAAYVNDESMDCIEQIRGPLWQNRLATRDFAWLPIFRPIKHVKDIRCRVQIFAAERDDLTPSRPAFEAARIAGERAELHPYPVGHFGVYVGELFQEIVAKQTEFLARELGDRG